MRDEAILLSSFLSRFREVTTDLSRSQIGPFGQDVVIAIGEKGGLDMALLVL